MSQIPLGIEVPGTAGSPVFSVTEITRLVKRYLEEEPLFRHVTICGEISNFKHHSSGHMYFVLKDAQSSIRCVMFRSQNSRLRFVPDNGLEVYATGSIGIYEAAGVYQLYVEYLEPRGLGDLHLAFEQLKARLRDEGLFDPTRKRPIPYLPRRIGIVTSPTGAAIQDMISIITRRMPGADILIAPAQVQGREAALSIVAALDALIRYGEVDVIILGRGGGSIEDLWPFNEELVARAVYASPIPIVSAVGHETDVTICDFVADLRAPTPSGAAELIVPVVAELLAGLGGLENRLRKAFFRSCHTKRERIAHLGRVLNSYSPGDVVKQRRQRLDELNQRLLVAIQRQLAMEKRELVLAAERLDSLSPLSILARGYAIARNNKTGEPVVSASQATIGLSLDVLLQDGIVQAEVTHIEEGDVLKPAAMPDTGEVGEE
jgi:exodeoxyribonuclease VII large subunit